MGVAGEKRSWPSAREPTEHGAGSDGIGDKAEIPTSILTSGLGSESSTPFAGGVGAGGAVGAGAVVVARDGDRARRVLQILRNVVIAVRHCLRFCGVGTARLVEFVSVVGGSGAREELVRAANRGRG